MRPDVWLTDVLGFPAFAADAAGGVPPGAGRALAWAKVDVADVSGVRRLCDEGYRVVDVNLTFERSAGGAPAEAAGVQPAAGAEGAALVEVAARSFRFSRFHLDPLLAPGLADRVKAEWVRSYVEGRRGVELLAAHEGDRAVGFLAVLEASDGARVIDLVAVAPEAQGRGHGRALVASFAARHGEGGRLLRVGTQAANVPSVRLYERLGFTLAAASYVLHLHRGAA